MQVLRASTDRRGATLVETAIVLPVLLVLALGMLDLAIGVFRYHIVSQGARQGARLAIVHGTLAPPQLNQWGPATYTGAADASDEIAQAIAPYLAGLNPGQVTIQVEWIDGSTDLEQRVRVTVSTSYTPFLLSVFGNVTYTLTGSSTMQIAH